MFEITYVLRKNYTTRLILWFNLHFNLKTICFFLLLIISESIDVAETSCSVLPAIGGAAACATAQTVKLNSDDEDSDDEKKENDQNEENGECPAVDKDGNVILHDNGNTATFRKGAKVTRNNVS